MPSFGIYASCVAQLEYLLAVVSQRTPMDHPKLRTIMVGHYGMREFEESDPDFSEALKNAQLIASNMADGLKPL
ncbi:immunity protein Tsi6 family protein [Pandoraea sputorum]|uniref:immunity protein Tsi6 family protein n=1 Tax=Pandoraea sputorum TaxID=93222 RepID=UPI00396A9D61